MTACPPTRVSSPDSRIGISCKWVNKRKNVLGDTKTSRDFLSIIACRECSPAEAGRAHLYGCPILTRRFGRSANGLVHGEGVKTIARTDQQVLLAVEHVRDRAGARRGHQGRMPQDFAVRGLESDDVLAIVGDQQPAGGAERMRDPAPTRPFVLPRDLAGLVTDRQEG